MFNATVNKCASFRYRWAIVLVLAVAVGVLVLIREPSREGEYQRARLESSAGTDQLAEESEVKLEAGEITSSYVSVASDETLDPLPGKAFLVSFIMHFERLPEKGNQQKIVYKYASNNAPYPGWAVAVRHRESSLRPEVYWRGADGNGGWFAFEEIEFDTGACYAVSLIAQGGAFISLYVQRIPSPSHHRSDRNDEVSDAVQNEIVSSEVVFAGGYDVADIRISPTEGDLRYFTSAQNSRKGCRGSVSQVLISRSDRLPKSLEEVKSFISGGVPALVQQLPPIEIGLWIDESGTDRSRYSRTVHSYGNSS